MKRSMAYFILVLILAVFGFADYFLLTSSASVTRIARGELTDLFGEKLRYSGLTASYFDEVLVLEDAEFFATKEHIKVLSADRAEVRFRGGLGKRIDQVHLDRPRLTLSKRLFAELEKMPEGDPIHEAVSPEELPSLFCRGGTLELIHGDVFDWKFPQAFSIHELSLIPSTGYRYLIHGLLESKRLGTWEIQGFFDLKTEDLDVRLTCERLDFEKKTRAVLNPRHHVAWDRYNPEGPARIQVSYRKKPGQSPGFEVTINPLGMGFTYAYFPYPMEDIHGELVFREDNFEIRHLEARNGSALVSFDGKGGGYASEADFRFRLRIRNMPLNHTLKNALGDGTGATIWNLFGDPTGSIDADGWIERDRGPDLPVRTPLDIGLREVSFQYAGFPYPARHVNGTIRVDLPRVTVLHVETSHPRWQVSPLGLIPDRSASFRIHGWVDDIDTDPSLDLFLKGRAIELDERIRKALGETGEDLWKRLQPTGVVDLDWHVRKRSGEEAVHAGVARLLGCTMEYDEIPLPVSGLTGEVRYRPERIELVALQGKSGDAEISLKGSLEEKTTQVDVRAVGLDLEPGTVEDLPREVREILQTLKLEGTVNADVNLAIHHGKERKIIGGVVLRVTDGEIKGDVPIKNMVGDAHLDVYVQGEEMLLSGPLQFSRITILGKEVKRLSTSLRKVGSNLSFLNLQGSVYEGVLTGEMNFDTKSDRFSGHLQVANLNLKSYSDSTQEFKDSESPEGKVDIEIRNLKGTGSDTATITGSGKITISQGRLWQVPVFAGLFSLDPTKWGGEPVFDAGSIYFDIADRKFRIKTLGFEGKGTSIVGKGEVDFDGNLDLKLRMESGSLFGIDFFLFRIPVQVVDILRNAILPIKVTGTLDEPKVNK